MDQLTDFLLATVSSPFVYVVVFAIVVIDGFFPPVPSESIVVVAAAIGVVIALVLGLVIDRVTTAIARRREAAAGRYAAQCEQPVA